jgi:hypothetical protein
MTESPTFGKIPTGVGNGWSRSKSALIVLPTLLRRLLRVYLLVLLGVSLGLLVRPRLGYAFCFLFLLFSSQSVGFLGITMLGDQ